jgi:hypothetical protein
MDEVLGFGMPEAIFGRRKVTNRASFAAHKN